MSEAEQQQPRTRRPYIEPDRLARTEQLWRAGVPTAEIARTMDRTKWAIYALAKTHGWPARKRVITTVYEVAS